MDCTIDREQSNLRHRRISTYSVVTWDEATRARVVDDLHWYNSTLYANLTVVAHLRADALRNWSTWEQIVSAFREGKGAQKSDPQFRFFVDPDAEPGIYEQLEQIDTRLPRLSVCPIVPTRAARSTLAHLEELFRTLNG